MTSLAFLIKLQNFYLKKTHESESYFTRGRTAHTDKIIFPHKHMQYQGHKLHIYPEGKKLLLKKPL